MKDILSDDTNSWRHFPRRSSKNCDLQFANTDRDKENYSIDWREGKVLGSNLFSDSALWLCYVQCSYKHPHPCGILLYYYFFRLFGMDPLRKSLRSVSGPDCSLIP